MKELKVTGLANETSFDNPNGTAFLIVLNGGELRIPTTKEGAEAVVKAMFNTAPPAAEGQDEEDEPEEPVVFTSPTQTWDQGPDPDEDGVPQA